MTVAAAERADTALAGAIAAISSAQFVTAALDYLRTIVPFRGCFLTLLQGEDRPIHLYDNVREERRAEVIDRYLDGAYLLDPFYVAYRTGAPCGVLRLSDVAPDRFQQSTYFRQYYNAIRLKDELAILIDLASGRHLFYSLGRLRDEPRFNAREVVRLRRALPVFAALNRRHFAYEAYVAGWDNRGADQGIGEALACFEAGKLTARERDIAGLILRGHSSQSIAATFCISPGTVKIHRKNIYRKLQISSQSELFFRFLSTLTSRNH